MACGCIESTIPACSSVSSFSPIFGHSIGMTMIEFPKIGEHDETELQAGMVLSMHPHAISADGEACLYMQDTWLVTDGGGVPLADLPMRIFSGDER
jgi:Xaa-Pro dipeptidase